MIRLKLDNEKLELEVEDLKRKMQNDRVRTSMSLEYQADQRLKDEVRRIEDLKDYQVKDTVNLVRSMLSGEMPVETYHRFKSIEPELLTTTEWLLVNMWESVAPIFEEVKRRRSEVNGLKLDIKVWNQKAEKYNSELSMIQKAVDMKDESFKRQIDEHKRERHRLTILNDSLMRDLKKFQEITGGPSNLIRDNERLKGHVDVLVDKVNLLLPTDFNEQTEKRVMDVENEKKLLRKENDYLATKEIESTEQFKSMEKKIKELREKIGILTEQNQKYITELLTIKEKVERQTHKTLNEQIDRQNMHHHVLTNNNSKI